MKVLLSGNEAIARGAYEAGIQIAAGYPGTPSSEILENMTQYKEIYSEWSVNEKVAMDMAAGAAYSGRRAIVTTKQVGVNVLSDSLFYTVYTGLEAGLVVVTADDPGMFSSQNEQDNRHYAKLGKFPLLEPADSQECKDFVIQGIAISEKFDVPVMVRTTMRTSHSKSVVILGERPPEKGGVGPFPRNMEKYNCMCLYAKKRHPVVEQRLLNLAKFAETFSWNRIEWGDRKLGIISCGVVLEYAKEVFPQASFLKLGMTYPLPENLIREFARGVERILVIEELDPFLEEQIKAMGIAVVGKEFFPPCDELLPQTIRRIAAEKGLIPETGKKTGVSSPASLPNRSPVLCPGCPHRTSFYLLNKMKLPVAGDIGCYNLGTLPPFSAQHTMGSMGASIGVLHGMGKSGLPEHPVCTIGDSTFFHAGIPPLLNMVHNKGIGTVIIMDNRTTAMTGHQDHPGIDKTLLGEPTKRVDIYGLVKAMGVEKVLQVNAFDVGAMEKALKECTTFKGTSVLIAEGECVFVAPTHARAAYEVDLDLCTACGLCAKLGCPAIVKAEAVHPKNKRNKSGINPVLCNGCEVCAQVCPTGAIRKIAENPGQQG
jgi:indolepyruvate ferredoxin oxidoreductase alpha subunit